VGRILKAKCRFRRSYGAAVYVLDGLAWAEAKGFAKRKGIAMADLRRKLVTLVSAVAILVAVVVLPGCGGDEPPTTPADSNQTTAPATK
jgi:hypothetical protein